MRIQWRSWRGTENVTQFDNWQDLCDGLKFFYFFDKAARLFRRPGRLGILAFFLVSIANQAHTVVAPPEAEVRFQILGTNGIAQNFQSAAGTFQRYSEATPSTIVPVGPEVTINEQPFAWTVFQGGTNQIFLSGDGNNLGAFDAAVTALGGLVIWEDTLKDPLASIALASKLTYVNGALMVGLLLLFSYRQGRAQ